MNDPLLSEDENLQRRDTRRAWWLIAGSAVLILLFAVFLYMRDESPPDDGWLLPKFTTPAGKANPLMDYIFEVQKLPQNKKESLNSRELNLLPGTEPSVEAFLAQRSDVLAAWQKLLQTDAASWGYPRPEPTDPFHHKLNLDRPWHPAMRLGKFQAVLYSRAGKNEAAVEHTLKMLKFWEDIQCAEGDLNIYATSMMGHKGAMITLETVLTKSAIDAALLEKAQAALEGGNFCRMDTLVKAAQVSYLQLTLDINSPNFKERYKKHLYKDEEELAFTLLFKRNRTRRLLSELYKPLLTAFNQDDREAYMLAAADFKAKGAAFKMNDWKDLVNPNAGSFLYLQNQIPDWEVVINSLHHCKARLDMIKIMLALRMYELKHGSLPETLVALCPDFLPRLPIDPISNTSFRWSLDKQRLYSIGLDLRDDGGEFTNPMDSYQSDVGMFYWWGEGYKRYIEEEQKSVIAEIERKKLALEKEKERLAKTRKNAKPAATVVR